MVVSSLTFLQPGHSNREHESVQSTKDETQMKLVTQVLTLLSDRARADNDDDNNTRDNNNDRSLGRHDPAVSSTDAQSPI